LGWIILTALVLLDAILDVIFAHGSGLESPIWKPIANLFRISNPLFITPFVLLIFYFEVKFGTWLTKKIDAVYIKTEELILTALVIVYSIFDLWLISLYFFEFKLIKNHIYLIPVLIIIGVSYSWWAENKLKNKK
jgi:hypothetical protein